MAAIRDLSELINRSSGGTGYGGTAGSEVIFFHKQPRVLGAAAPNTIAGRYHSLWMYEGQPPNGLTTGITSGAGLSATIPTNTSSGALGQTGSQPGNEKWMTQAAASGLVGGVLILYDRLLHNRNLSGTSVSQQSVQGEPPSPTITRYTDGVGNIMFAEIYTAIGATLRTLTVRYTNENGLTGRTSTIPIGGTNLSERTRVLMVPLTGSDRGVRAIERVQLDATTGTVGDFGMVIGHPLAFLCIGGAGQGGWRDFSTGLPSIPKIENNAHIAFLWTSNTTTPPEIFGAISMVEA